MLIATLVTCLAMLTIAIPALARVTPRQERLAMLFCALAAAPMSWIMFHGVRLPVEEWLKSVLGEGELLRAIRTCYAPLTEEPAKLWPLLLPWIRRAIQPQSVARFAVALGGGFALGEVVTVALLIAERQPQIAALPWYQLSGFIFERLETFLVHAGMTALVLASWQRGPGFLPGLLLAMFAHWLVNFPITMAQRGWLGPNSQIAQTIVVLWIATCAVAAFFWLSHLDIGRVGLGEFLYGRAQCPGCGHEYPRRLSGLNLGGTRYEPCPHCHHWHLTKGKITARRAS